MTTAEKIKKTIEEIGKMKTALQHQAEVRAELAELENALDKMEYQLDKELEDVEKLESLGVKSIFYKVLGSREEQLEKERQEYLALTMKHKELKQSIKITKYELDIISKKIVGFERLKEDLEGLKKVRYREILQFDEKYKDRLVHINEQKDEINYTLTEMREARSAGIESLKYVQIVSKHLKDAANWGQWDMYKNNRHYDYMKHTSIDKAMDAAYRAKHFLKIFKNELKDIGMNGNDIVLQVDSFSKFTDIFLDNLISDWIIQRKINNVAASVNGVHDKVSRICQSIERNESELKANHAKLEAEMDQILTL